MEARVLSRKESILFIALLIMISGASAIGNSIFFRVFVLSLLLVVAIMRRKRIDRVLFYVLSVWTGINVIAVVYLRSSINFWHFGGMLTTVLLSFLYIIVIGKDFWSKLERFLFFMVEISFIVYLVSLIIPSFFNALAPLFRPFTDPVFYRKETQYNYYYAFFYSWMGRESTSTILRNSGIMWEPGAFAMLLVILLSLNITNTTLNRKEKRRHNLLYAISLVTTQSTAGYIACIPLIIAAISNTKNKVRRVGFLLLVPLLAFVLFRLDFIAPKISDYLEDSESESLTFHDFREQGEANRILSWNLLIDKTLQLPTGWGAVNDDTSFLAKNNIVTINGLGNVMVIWGIPVLLLILVAVVVFFYGRSSSWVVSICVLISLLVVFFSNPVERNMIMYLIPCSFLISRTNENSSC